jgi:hypothetical protein
MSPQNFSTPVVCLKCNWRTGELEKAQSDWAPVRPLSLRAGRTWRLTGLERLEHPSPIPKKMPGRICVGGRPGKSTVSPSRGKDVETNRRVLHEPDRSETMAPDNRMSCGRGNAPFAGQSATMIAAFRPCHVIHSHVLKARMFNWSSSLGIKI